MNTYETVPAALADEGDRMVHNGMIAKVQRVERFRVETPSGRIWWAQAVWTTENELHAMLPPRVCGHWEGHAYHGAEIEYPEGVNFEE